MMLSIRLTRSAVATSNSVAQSVPTSGEVIPCTHNLTLKRNSELGYPTEKEIKILSIKRQVWLQMLTKKKYSITFQCKVLLLKTLKLRPKLSRWLLHGGHSKQIYKLRYERCSHLHPQNTRSAKPAVLTTNSRLGSRVQCTAGNSWI